MSTEPETTEHAEPGAPGTTGADAGRGTGAPAGARGGGGDSPGPQEAGTGSRRGGDGESGGTDPDDREVPHTDGGHGDGDAGGAGTGGGGPADEDPGPRDPRTGEGAGAGDADAGSTDAAGEGGNLSEAEAELLAQRLERERIERRKAERQGPIESGRKLSGKAADLLAAVRAVESGRKPAAPVFDAPAPKTPRPAPEPPRPEPVHRPQPAPAAAPAPPAPEAVQALRRVLAAGGAPEALAPQVAAVLGESADERLRTDPWQLLRVPGVRPEQADGFARTLLGAECGPGDERRGRAVAGWLLEQAALAGHTALELPQLTAALGRYGVPDADAAVQSTLAEGEALLFQDALEEPGGTARRDDATQEDGADGEAPARVLVGLERYALAEESLADGLARLVNSAPARAAAEEDWERAASAQGSAADLIRAVAAHGLVLHTGGEASLAEPAALLRAAHGLGLRAWAATPAPAGRARFAALLDRPADTAAAQPSPVTTVTGLLAGSEGPGRDADGALDLDLLIVFDAPQLDVEAAALLTESLPDGARLVLAGDPAVLWSAGPGRVFADLLAARICPRVASRRPDPGPLGELVSGIGVGELNQVRAPGKEVVIVPVRDAGEAVHRTVQLVADSVPRAIGVPAGESQVITPGHGGAVGTRALNAALKERLNPGPGRFGGFDPGDRVAYSPVPGRTLPGRVVGADADGLHLSCADEAVVVPKEQVERCVRHGWALTAHQAAGGRWPAVVVVLPGDAVPALSRPWIYTAFGRAERHLSVVHGVEQALPRAVAEVAAKPRTTRLPALLAPQVPAAG
ncbi:ATP-dependent RecD-like DNA helicase [Streptomyces sp. enrichment culture]|uniref:ATP-binding domain-containing protein n=1 Tax=Streptomyces sp. enrichment culture TaxID=1795815 RepID=UPI003F545C1F